MRFLLAQGSFSIHAELRLQDADTKPRSLHADRLPAQGSSQVLWHGGKVARDFGPHLLGLCVRRLSRRGRGVRVMIAF